MVPLEVFIIIFNVYMSFIAMREIAAVGMSACVYMRELWEESCNFIYIYIPCNSYISLSGGST